MEVLKMSCGHIIAEGDKVKVVQEMDLLWGGAAVVKRGSIVDLLRISPSGTQIRVETLDLDTSSMIIKNWENL